MKFKLGDKVRMKDSTWYGAERRWIVDRIYKNGDMRLRDADDKDSTIERYVPEDLERVSYWGTRYRCEKCGKKLVHPTGFQTWQVAGKTTGRHHTASWCSCKCFKSAEKREAGMKQHYTKKGICNYCAGVEK